MIKYRIGVLGIGGTGGFFGGKLALHYANDNSVDVVFIARNENKKAIAQNGLVVESVEGDFTAIPSLVSDDLNEIGKLDVLLVCVKSFALEDAIDHYKSALKKDGVIITIQNLVNQVERLEKLMPKDVHLLEGCAYIISNLISPGHVVHKGGPATLFFGSSETQQDYSWVENIFLKADIKVTLSKDIKSVIWQKFLFVSPVAIAANYFQCSLGELNDNSDKKEIVKNLMLELYQLIEIKKIPIDKSIVNNHLELLGKMPKESKASFQLDIEQGKKSEVDSLLRYVVDEGRALQCAMPYYQKSLDAFNK